METGYTTEDVKVTLKRVKIIMLQSASEMGRLHKKTV